MSRIAALLIALITLSSSYAATSLSIDFSKTINTVPDYMYGTNVKGSGGNPSYIYLDGTTRALANYTWHRQMIDAANINYMRKDMYLECNSKADGTFWHTGDCSNIDISTSQVEWAAQSGKKMLFIASYMPTWLADVSAICASRHNSCPPTSYDRWGKLVVDFLDVVTQNGKYADSIEVEVWNEPYLSFLASDGTIQDRISIYMKLYNATYAAIKAKYPQIRVGGPSGTYGYMQGPVLSDAFFAQVDPDKVDFVTMHEYGDAYLVRDMQTAMDRIRAAGFGDKEVEWTEYQVSDSTVQLGNPNTYYRYLANTMMYMLNNESNVKSMDFYQWMEPYPYNAQDYWEYPSRFDMVSDPSLSNKLYVGFNFSRDFGTYHPAGAKIVQSASTKSNLQILASNGTKYHFTITDSNGVSATTINITGLDIANVTDIRTGQVYVVNNGVVDVGIVSNSVRHFLASPAIVEENITSPENITIQDNSTISSQPETPIILEPLAPIPPTPKQQPMYGQQQQTYAGYVAQYDKADLPLIVSDGIGTLLASIVDFADLIVIAGVLSYLWYLRFNKF